MARPQRTNRRSVVAGSYLVAALLLSALVLPSALRPPPQQTSESAALSADAPPDDQVTEQVIQVVEQAAGSSAGASETEATTTIPATTVPEVPTTLPPASGNCVGSPARQNFSVYAPECAPAFTGDNGGSTSKNVFPDEIRIGWFHGFGSPSPGRLEETPSADDTHSDRTFRVWAQWFNENYQFYGRKIVFYGLEGPSEPEENQAEVRKAIDQYKLFTASHPHLVFCDEFAAELPMWCVSVPDRTFAHHAGRAFAYPMSMTQVAQNGAEYLCKRIVGRPPKFAGDDVKLTSDERVIAYTTTVGNAVGGAPADDFVRAYERQCGEKPAKVFEFNPDGGEGQEALAAREMFQAGVTTIVTQGELYSNLYMMLAADSLNWHPEWVMLANWGSDNNTAAKLYPQTQMTQTFGLSTWELPQRPDQTECYAAYHEIDPANDPAPLHCAFWQQLVLIMNGIQKAGPDLSWETYRDGLFDLGYICGHAIWMTCGSIKPNDYSFTDELAQIWWDPNAVAPDDGAPGAYWYTDNGARFGLGEWTADDSGLFNEEGSLLEPPP